MLSPTEIKWLLNTMPFLDHISNFTLFYTLLLLVWLMGLLLSVIDILWVGAFVLPVIFWRKNGEWKGNLKKPVLNIPWTLNIARSYSLVFFLVDKFCMCYVFVYTYVHINDVSIDTVICHMTNDWFIVKSCWGSEKWTFFWKWDKLFSSSCLWISVLLVEMLVYL